MSLPDCARIKPRICCRFDCYVVWFYPETDHAHGHRREWQFNIKYIQPDTDVDPLFVSLVHHENRHRCKHKNKSMQLSQHV